MVVLDDEIAVCPDCLIFIANGDLPDDEADAARVLVGVEWLQREGGTLVCGEDESGEGLGFSWSSCDCCDGLAGDRSPAALIGPAPAT